MFVRLFLWPASIIKLSLALLAASHDEVPVCLTSGGNGESTAALVDRWNWCLVFNMLFFLLVPLCWYLYCENM